jgi:hypothetical protein
MKQCATLKRIPQGKRQKRDHVGLAWCVLRDAYVRTNSRSSKVGASKDVERGILFIEMVLATL